MSKSTKPIVSVVIPCYQHQDYVEQCLMSVYNQTFEDIELVFIDDCSRDDSYQLAASVASSRRFKRRFRDTVIVRNNENLGAHATINKGLLMARGNLYKHSKFR